MKKGNGGVVVFYTVPNKQREARVRGIPGLARAHGHAAGCRKLRHDCSRQYRRKSLPTKNLVRTGGYIFAGVADGILLFLGMGSLPSAEPVKAMNWGSSRSEAKTASTRASIISLERTAS